MTEENLSKSYINKITYLENLIRRLNSIGIKLSTQDDSNDLFNFILDESLKITNCDGGSIYIKKIKDGKEFLEFSYTQNNSKVFPFNKFLLPLDKNSIAGYSGFTGEIFNFKDMNDVKEAIGISHNKKFDEQNNYCTKNMLVIPMKNFSGQITGVIQLINKKIDYDKILSSQEDFDNFTLPFSKEEEEIVSSLTSQSSILLERNSLLDDIRKLFKTFIESLVTTLDQRDPVTAGHSSRVAKYSICLANVINEKKEGSFKDFYFSKDEMRELYYSGLLHDIGKIGVHEGVLLKRNRLSDQSIEKIKCKCEVLKFNLAYSTELFSKEDLTALIDSFSITCNREALFTLEENHRELVKFAKKNSDIICEKIFEEILEINKSGFLSDEKEQFLDLLRNVSLFDFEKKKFPLIIEDEFINLKIKRGNLNSAERKMIENHPLHTFDILKEISWTSGLKEVPKYASTHHEKLNGFGYPWGLKENEINMQSRILAITDIFDALTASDRPYKPAMSIEKTVSILREEAEKNSLDLDLVELFIEEKAYSLLNKIDYEEIY